MTEVHLVLSAWAIAAAVMVVTWVVASARQNAGIVDVVWAFGTETALARIRASPRLEDCIERDCQRRYGRDFCR